MGTLDKNTRIPSLPFAVLEKHFKLLPHYLPLWQRISAGASDFTTHETAQLLVVESDAYTAIGSYGTALQLSRQALDLGHEDANADAWASIARILVMLGRYAESNAAAFESLAIDDSHYSAVNAWNALALSGLYTNQFDEAQRWFERALSLSVQLNFEYGIARVLHNQSLLYRDRGEFELYIASISEGTRIYQKIGGPLWPAVMAKLQTAIIRGKRGAAREILKEYEALGPQGLRIDGTIDLLRGLLAADEEDYGAAEGYLQNALSVADSTGESFLGFAVKSAYGRLRRLQGDAAAAAGWSKAAVVSANRVGSRAQEAEAHTELARAQWALGETEAAEAELLTALDIALPLGAAYWAAVAAFLLAGLHIQQQRPSAEAMWVDAARRIRKGGYEFIYERERELAFPMLAQFVRSGNAEAKQAAEQALAQLAKVPPVPLRIAGLGRFEVWRGRRRIADRDWQQRRAGELFRLLLLQPGHSAAREAIAEALCPNQPLKAAQTVLHHATSRLRRILEPDLPEKFPSRYIRSEADQIGLDLPSGSLVDFEEFDRRLAPAGNARTPQRPLEETLALYAGELYPADRYADWSANMRERLSELHRCGLMALAAEQLGAGNAEAALGACRQILSSEPWHEDAVLTGMQACLAMNNRPAALGLYQTLEQTLRAELRVTPRRDLRALAASIRKD